ncbi:hypothetical protein [Vibrio taketomensis]|uniref:hypothetical protein n=1 Tax=Vibrio taketomensis TaxID=2572923 RepID=UPI00138A2D78|nr:hypothetical protein [Vibrio taketomensis]
MSKLKITVISLFVIACAVAAWVFIPTHTTVGRQISETPVGENMTLVGFKVISTEKKLNMLNQYYLIANGTEIDDQEPIITTSDQFLLVENVKDNTFKLSVKGRIEQYRNDAWVEKSDGTVEHWFISLDSSYIR